MTLENLLKNKVGLAKLEGWYTNAVRPSTLAEAFEDDSWKFGANLRGSGVVCAHCGGRVTGQNLATANFLPSVICSTCISYAPRIISSAKTETNQAESVSCLSA